MRTAPQTNIPAGSRGAPKKPPSSSGPLSASRGEPLASSSRVINAPAPGRAQAQAKPASAGPDIRRWIAQPIKHEDMAVDDSWATTPKGKGKAAVRPPQVPPVTGATVKQEPVSVKLEPRSPARVKLEPSVGVKLEPATGVKLESFPRVKLEHAPPTKVKAEPGPRVKLESGAPLSPSSHPARHQGPDRSASSLSSRQQAIVTPTRPPVGSRSTLDSQASANATAPASSQTHSLLSSSPAYSQPRSSMPSLPSSSSSSPDYQAPAEAASTKPSAVKRRLGMGRATTGYANKKFKPIVPNT